MDSLKPLTSWNSDGRYVTIVEKKEMLRFEVKSFRNELSVVDLNTENGNLHVNRTK